MLSRCSPSSCRCDQSKVCCRLVAVRDEERNAKQRTEVLDNDVIRLEIALHARSLGSLANALKPESYSPIDLAVSHHVGFPATGRSSAHRSHSACEWRAWPCSRSIARALTVTGVACWTATPKCQSITGLEDHAPAAQPTRSPSLSRLH